MVFLVQKVKLYFGAKRSNGHGVPALAVDLEIAPRTFRLNA